MAVEAGIAIGKPCARQVRSKDLESAGESWQHLPPTEPVAQQPVHQNQCRSGSGMGEADPESIHQSPFLGGVWGWFRDFSAEMTHYLLNPDNFPGGLRSLLEQISPLSLM